MEKKWIRFSIIKDQPHENKQFEHCTYSIITVQTYTERVGKIRKEALLTFAMNKSSIEMSGNEKHEEGDIRPSDGTRARVKINTTWIIYFGFINHSSVSIRNSVTKATNKYYILEDVNPVDVLTSTGMDLNLNVKKFRSTRITIELIKSLTEEDLKCFYQNDNSSSYVDTMIIFETFKSTFEKDRATSTENFFWENNLLGNDIRTNRRSISVNNGVVFDLNILRQLLTHDGKRLIGVPTVGELFINGFYKRSLRHLVSLVRKIDSEVDKSSDDRSILYMCFCKALVYQGIDSVSGIYSVSNLIKSAATNAISIGTSGLVPVKMKKLVIRLAKLGTPNFYVTFKTGFSDSFFMETFHRFINDCLTYKALAIYRIETDKSLIEVKSLKNENLCDYKVTSYHLLDQMKIINKFVEKLLSNRNKRSFNDQIYGRAEDYIAKGKCTKSQEVALRSLSTNEYLQVTGAGGTGKTFLISAIVEILVSIGWKVLIVTNYCISANVLKARIASTMADTKLPTSAVDVMTMESFYCKTTVGDRDASSDFGKNQSYQCLIIDEGQNNSIAMRAKLYDRLGGVSKVIELGDDGYQIPPIGYGFPMRDAFEGGACKRVELIENVRAQSEESAPLRALLTALRNQITDCSKVERDSVAVIRNEDCIKEVLRAKTESLTFKTFDNQSEVIRGIFDAIVSAHRDKKYVDPILGWFIMTPRNRECDDINIEIHDLIMRYNYYGNTSNTKPPPLTYTDPSKYKNPYPDRQYIRIYNVETKRYTNLFAGTKIIITENYNYSIIGDRTEGLLLKKHKGKKLNELLKSLDYEAIRTLNGKLKSSFVSSQASNKEQLVIVNISDKKIGYDTFRVLTVATEIVSGKTELKQLVMSIAGKGHIKPSSIKLAYCTTVDSSLGSEQTNCIAYLPPHSVHHFTAQKLYTMVSRSKKNVYLMSHKATITESYLCHFNSSRRNTPISIIDVITVCSKKIDSGTISETYKFRTNDSAGSETQSSTESISLDDESIISDTNIDMVTSGTYKEGKRKRKRYLSEGDKKPSNKKFKK